MALVPLQVAIRGVAVPLQVVIRGAALVPLQSLILGSSFSDLTGSGRIAAYTPGSDYIMFRRESSNTPVRYYCTKSTVLVDPEGHPVTWTALRLDMPVTYTYVKEADRMVVTKVTLAARLPVEKRETEATTTKP